MKEKTKEWLRVILSIFVFNLIILIVLFFCNLFSPYTLTLKILLDISIGFITDKSIKHFSVNWRKGFVIKRE